MMDEYAAQQRQQNRRRQRVVLAFLGAGCIGMVAFTLGYFSHTPAPAPIVVANEPPPPVIIAPPAEPEVESASVAALQERQARVTALEALLSDREAELAALKAEDQQDDARRAEAQKRWRAMEAEISQLRADLAQVTTERDQLRVELKQALTDLDTQIAATQHARKRAHVYKKASDQNLWFAFLNDAKVQICDKGTRRAHEKCHDAVDTFFDQAAETRFAACVSSHQAVPVLRQQDPDDGALPNHSVALPDDNRFTRKDWYVLYCDPTLPEAVAQDDIDAPPQTFARLDDRQP